MIKYPLSKITVEERCLPVKELVLRFRDAGRFLPFCRACENFGARWSCPPLVFDSDAFLNSFDRVALFAARFFFDESIIVTADTPEAVSRVLSRTAEEGKAAIARTLLEMEPQVPGSESLSAGSCHWCAECSRVTGLPCIHPERMRLSLDALGFDLTAILGELFGIELLWPSNCLPAYCTLVTGLLVGGQEPKTLAPQLEAALRKEILSIE